MNTQPHGLGFLSRPLHAKLAAMGEDGGLLEVIQLAQKLDFQDQLHLAHFLEDDSTMTESSGYHSVPRILSIHQPDTGRKHGYSRAEINDICYN